MQTSSQKCCQPILTSYIKLFIKAKQNKNPDTDETNS